MKIRSVKTNFFLNLIKILSSSLIGVFTMPYINETLGAVSIGKVEYVNAIINYFILFSAIGIPIYGIRQVAKVRENPLQLTSTVVELGTVLFINTIISFLILGIGILYFSEFKEYTSLLIVMSSMLLLNNLGFEWFFQGIEDQLYITVRYVLIRIITVVLLFLLVKSSDDYLEYATIVSLNFAGSNFLNFFRLRKYIKIRDIDLKRINIKQHIKPSLTIFLSSIAISFYLQIDTFMLGYLSGDKYVGYYSVANKLLRYVVLFITSLGMVMLPRLSNLWTNNKVLYNYYLQKTFSLFIIISIPFGLYFYFFSENIIFLMAGNDFREAVITLKLLSPICIFVALAYFFGYLILYVQNYEKIYSIAVFFAAVVSVIVNLFIIDEFKHNGAAFTQLFSEFVALFIMISFLFYKKRIKVKRIDFNNITKILLANLSLLFILLISRKYFIDYKIFNTYLSFIFISCVFFIVNVIFLLMLKERYIFIIFGKLSSRINKI